MPEPWYNFELTLWRAIGSKVRILLESCKVNLLWEGYWAEHPEVQVIVTGILPTSKELLHFQGGENLEILHSCAGYPHDYDHSDVVVRIADLKIDGFDIIDMVALCPEDYDDVPITMRARGKLELTFLENAQ